MIGSRSCSGRGRSWWRCWPQDEFAYEHLPGAINIPLKTLDAASAARLDRDKPVIVYCYDTQ